MITEKNIYFNYCKNCTNKIPRYCCICYCYNCGDHYPSCTRHKCDPKRVKRHYAAMQAADARGNNPQTRTPSYGKQLEDGFSMLDQDK